MKIKRSLLILLVMFAVLPLCGSRADEPRFEQVQTILTKYCAGCHNADDANGEFAMDKFESLVKGGENGNALTAGSSASSRMIQMMRNKLEPAMPPEGEPAPSDDEIQLLADWIDAGAPGPDGESALPDNLVTPEVESRVDQRPITALALTGNETKLAIARFGSIEIRDAGTQKVVRSLDNLPGKVTSLSFLNQDKWLLAGTGVVGLYGEAVLYGLDDGKPIRRFRGHRDMVYSIAVSPNEKHFATSGYDRKSVLWNLFTEKPVREFVGHNDAVFENLFDISGERLITASADATVKIWRVGDAQRLDTRGEPLKEQYTAAVSPDGRWIFAGGEDNRIRKWELVSQNPDQTNPLAIARFAHESAIQHLRIHPAGEHLVSVSSRGVIKIWTLTTLSERHQFNSTNQNVPAIAVGNERLYVGRLDGSLDVLEWPVAQLNQQVLAGPPVTANVEIDDDKSTDVEIQKHNEIEPNDSIDSNVSLSVPFETSGVIDAEDRVDVDIFGFTASQGQRLIIETNAAQQESPLDTQITVLDRHGNPIPRVLLQAVRDSYFTFRGKDSTQTGDFRVHNWEEMKLNQLLYCNGEVVRLYHYPRGPDSGYNVYPNFGKRHAMFDTTPITHALHEPCFIVEPHPPGTELPATGLPQFLLNYENDDDAEQELGTDSRLTFTVPADGEYYVRIRDSRDFSGSDFKYKLTVRPAQPGFEVTAVKDNNPKLIRNGYKQMSVTIDRIDNFEGEVDISLEDLPTGITVSKPVSIEANGLQASFTLLIDRSAELLSDAPPAKLIASATIAGTKQVRVKELGKIEVDESPKLAVELLHADKSLPHFDQNEIPVLEIRPGETIAARVRVQRLGHEGRVNFGKEDAARNLPFGVYVDNTGLNGVLIPPKENERTFFLTAEDWVQPCSRLIFLEAEEAGKPSSNPAVLRVLPVKNSKVATR